VRDGAEALERGGRRGTTVKMGMQDMLAAAIEERPGVLE
jgi:hypothetical protein